MANPNYTKLVVCGSTGMLGSYIYKYFQLHSNYLIKNLNRDTYDATRDNSDMLVHVLKELGVDDKTIVFNAIGAIPHAQGASTDHHVYSQVNEQFPKSLSYACKALGARLIHPTTDCVFSGSKGMYIESDAHDADTMYGQSKSRGENIEATIIRTSIIGENKKGISLVEWIKKHKNAIIDGYTNHFWNGITCLEYAKMLKYLMDTDTLWTGVRHVYSPHYVSKHQLCNMVNEIYKLNIEVHGVCTEKSCDRTLSSIHQPIYTPKSLQEQIHEMHEFAQLN